MIGCVLVPYFAVAVERRDDPSLTGVPLIIVGLARDPSRVFAVSHEAAQVGVEPEMTLRQAQSLCPQAHPIPADQPRYQRAFDEFLEVLFYFTPGVEPDGQGPGAIGYLDLGRLKGAELIEMAKRIGQTVRGEVSLAPALGVADGKFPAYVAAASTQPNRVLIVAPGQEVAFLAPFPVDLLPLDGEVLRRLRLLGIRTLGQLAALPSSAVITQLGAHGQTLHRLAQGRDDRPILPHHPEEVERASRQFEDFITSRTTLEAIAKAMAIDLADRLQARGLVARQLRLVLHLEDEAIHQEQLVMRHPSSAPGRLASILGELVAEIQLQQGVSEIDIILANLIPARGQQLDLFIHQTRQRQRLDDVLKDLLARYGAGCFYQASLFDRTAPLLERRFQMQEMETP